MVTVLPKWGRVLYNTDIAPFYSVVGAFYSDVGVPTSDVASFYSDIPVPKWVGVLQREDVGAFKWYTGVSTRQRMPPKKMIVLKRQE